MQDLGALRARLLLESKQFKEGMQEARQEMLKSGKAADESSKEIKKIKDSMKSLDDSKRHAVEATRSLDKVSKSLRDVGMSSKQIDKIQDQIRKTNPQILENEIKEVREELVKLGMSSKEIDKITKEMRTANSAVEKFQIGLNEIQLASLAVGVAVGAGIGASVKVAATFEKQMSNVKAVSGATAQEMDKLSEMAMKLGESTSFSANEVAMGMEELIKAGLSVEQILNGGLAGALDLAAAGQLDLASAAEIASTALNAFRDDNLSVSKAADILAGAANASATDIGELKYGLSAVSAVASGMGMNFEDTATALAVFAQNGVKGSDAGTSLKTMLMNLEPTTKKTIEMFHDLGWETADGRNAFYDMNGELRSLDEIAGLLQSGLKDMTDQQRALTLETIFGSDAVRAGNILYKEGADGVKKMADAMGKISAADVAKIKLDNLISSFEEFKGTLETVGIKIGNELLPTFKEIVNSGTDILRVFSELDPATVATGIKMAGAGAGAALLVSTLAKLRVATMALFTPLNPTGWLILGVSALAAAYVGYNDVVGRNAEVNLDSARSMIEQERSLNKNIERFEALREKMDLTSYQLERYVDLQSEMASTADTGKLEDLRREQEKLLESSGLTNEEMTEYLKLNGDLIETVPQSTLKITEKGNALISETDTLRNLNSEQREKIKLELENQMITANANYTDNLEKEEKLKNQIKEHNQAVVDLGKEIASQQAKLNEEEAKYKEAKENGNIASELWWGKQVEFRQQEIESLKDNLKIEHDKFMEKKASLEITQKELAKLDEIEQEMVQLELAQVGLNGKKGDGLKIVDDEIVKLQKQRDELFSNTSATDRQNSEFQESIQKIDSQIGGLKRARENIEGITGEQSRTNSKISEGARQAEILQRKLGMDVTKKVTIVGGNAEAQRLHELLSQPAYKTVYVNEANLQRGLRQNERAYRNTRHQGGTLFELPEFHQGGSPAFLQSLMTAPNHNEVDVRLLRDEMVLTQAQQGELFRRLDNRQVLQAPLSNGEVLSVLYNIESAIKENNPSFSLEIDGEKFAEKTARPMAKHIERINTGSSRSRGEY
jgi:TP901 family phage tail tape measure protein